MAIKHAKARNSLILATDLDGTFAGGTADDRDRLQRLLHEREGTVLIYVTGRSIPAAREIMRDAPLPHPDYLIADVGTSVRAGAEFDPVEPIEAWIDSHWPDPEAIRARMVDVPGLEEQAVDAPRRVSYWIRTGSMNDAIERAAVALDGMAVDLVASADVYLDVLPHGVNKGTTLLRLLRWLERDDDDVVVAGDTLNDLALFQTGLAGVVVGNSESALLERVRGEQHLYLASGEGAAGILEGLRHFGWLKKESTHGE